MTTVFGSADAVNEALDGVNYLADRGTSFAAYLAIETTTPLLVEGDPGVGKTALAEAIALITRRRLVRLQCYEGIDVSQALYDWNFPKQILHLRAMEQVTETAAVEKSLYDRRFLISRPILEAIEEPSVLLLDEVDRADDEFEALLLEFLAEKAVTIPEIGRVAADTPPITVLTSNRTRDVHDALKRRCFYHWISHPDVDREISIIRRHLPDAIDRIVTEVALMAHLMRGMDLAKPPGVAESIQWADALTRLGVAAIDQDSAMLTLGAVVKLREDTTRVQQEILGNIGSVLAQ